MKRALLAALAALGAACARDGWSYTTPEVLGEEALLASLRPEQPGELVLANFWATWCGPCVTEMPELVALRPSLAAEHVRLLAVSLDLPRPQAVDSPERLAAFAEHRDLALPIVAFQGDLDALAARLRLPAGPPCTIVFGPEGELGRIEGAATRTEFEALVAKARGR